MHNVLVTGGAGFIGSNFVRTLLRERGDIRIVNFDKLTYAGNLENLSDIRQEPRYTFVRGDICDRTMLDAAFREYAIDTVVHFAAESHVDRSILGASVFIQTNVAGTQVLLDAARNRGVERFLHVSTDEVYGSLGAEGRFSETTPLHPNSPYAASKASADLLVRSYCHTHGFPGIITRCSNNYGPYQFPEKLIPLLISNALAGEPVPIYGDGMNVRDWIYVRDHCTAIDAVLHRGKIGEVYNIGARQELPNLYVARRILKLLDRDESLITFVEDRPGHDRRYAIDCLKMERELRWRAQVLFDSGLRDTILWYRRNSAWVEHVRSGAYRTYYDRMYRQRHRTLSQR